MDNGLLEKIAGYHHFPAIIIDDKTYSYADILACCKELNQLSVAPGFVMYIKGNYQPYTIAALLWALDKQIIIIPVSSQSSSHMNTYLNIIPANIILDCEDATSKPNIINYSLQRFSHPLTDEIIDKRDSALILFSSGTTGQPKAAVHDFNVFLEKFVSLKKHFSAIVFLNFDHVGGLNTLFSVIVAGGTVLIPGSTQPANICAYIKKNKIDLLPTTPSFLRMLLMSNAINKTDLSSLKIISYGTEFMPENTLKKLKEQLPQVSFKQTYGSTEIGILATQSKADDSTWFKIDDKKTPYKIIDDILWIKSKAGSLKGYLNASFSVNDNWVNTQDRVEQQGEFLRILGRDTELINVGGNKVDPHEVEELILKCEHVKDVVVYPKNSPILGQVVIAKVSHLDNIDDEQFKKNLQEWCEKHLEPFKRPAYFIIEADIDYSPRWKKIRG